MLCTVCKAPYVLVDPNPCLWFRRYACKCEHVACLAGVLVCECSDCAADLERCGGWGGVNKI